MEAMSTDIAPRLAVDTLTPELSKAMSALEAASRRTSLESSLQQLVRLRASTLSRRSRKPFSIENIAVFMPMPRARVTMATSVNPGVRSRERRAWGIGDESWAMRDER